jgi:hypothetical protein
MKQRLPHSKITLVKRIFLLVFIVVILRNATEGGDTLSAVDEQGSTWKITSVKDPPLRTLLNRKVKPGLPLTVGARVRRKGSMMRLDLVIKGQAGETYRPRVAKDGKYARLPTPSFTVLDRSGKSVGSGKFQFG